MADNQNAVSRCPRCGATLAADAPDQLCPRCLFALNFVTETETPSPGEASTGAHDVKTSPPPAPSPDTLGPHFPHLEVLEILGRGGMGVVYKARQPKLDRFVALKILLRRDEGPKPDTAFAERFAREGRALARLSHPHIVAVYDYGEAGGYPFLLMEYVDGVTLRQLLERGGLVPEEALAIVPKICEALQFAHERGIVHRDIKPENILLDKSGQVKITDFGIAKVIRPSGPDRSLTGAKDVMGTPHYMAPEQIEEPAKVDHRADIFSLGVVFYEMLTGELPLGKFQRPSNKVQIDVRLDEVVLRALAKEPERRYQQASQVKTAVEIITTTGEANAATPAASSSVEARQPPLESAGELPRLCPAALFATLIVWFLPFSIVLTTSLGWIAVGQIRRSSGRLSGLGLAVFDGLFFPLLALDAFIVSVPICVWLWLGFQPSALGAVNLDSKLLFLLTVVVALAIAAAVDDRLIRRVWRAVNKPLTRVEHTTYEPGEPFQQPSSGARLGLAHTPSDALSQKAVANKSQLALILEILCGTTFTSPQALKLIKLSALGFLSALAFLGYVPLPGWERFFGFSGFAGLFGLIGFAFLVELAQRIKKKPSVGTPSDSSQLERTPAEQKHSETPSGASPAGRLIRRILGRAALVCLLQLVWLETIQQGTPHWRESTAELWLITFFLSSIAALGWVIWPLCRERRSLLLRVTVAIALFGGVFGLDVFYSTIVRPNLGLYEEEDWLSQVPGLRWGWRQKTAHALWHRPAAGPFTATVETILPLDNPSRIELVDLDTGRQSGRDKFAADDEEALAWVQAEKFDLGAASQKNTVRILGLGLRTAYIPVPRLVRVEELTPQAAVNYWALDRKPASAVAELQVHNDMTGTYAFHTRDGGIGFLEFAGLGDNPRGVRLRYKLVQKPNDSSSAPTSGMWGTTSTTQAVSRQQVEAR